MPRLMLEGITREVTTGGKGWTIGSPYLVGSVTQMKILLPVGKARAWNLIATPEGLASSLKVDRVGFEPTASTMPR